MWGLSELVALLMNVRVPDPIMTAFSMITIFDVYYITMLVYTSVVRHSGLLMNIRVPDLCGCDDSFWWCLLLVYYSMQLLGDFIWVSDCQWLIWGTDSGKIGGPFLWPTAANPHSGTEWKLINWYRLGTKQQVTQNSFQCIAWKRSLHDDKQHSSTGFCLKCCAKSALIAWPCKFSVRSWRLRN